MNIDIAEHDEGITIEITGTTFEAVRLLCRYASPSMVEDLFTNACEQADETDNETLDFLLTILILVKLTD